MESITGKSIAFYIINGIGEQFNDEHHFSHKVLI